MRAHILLLALLALCGFSQVSLAQETLEDFASSSPSDTEYTIVDSLLTDDEDVDASIKEFVNSTDAAGVVFAPSDGGFSDLLTALGFPGLESLTPAFKNALLEDHIIDGEVSGNDEEVTFTARSGHDLNVTFDASGALVSVTPASAPPQTFAQQVSVNADTPMYATSSGNATLYFVDAALVTAETISDFIGEAALSFYAALKKVTSESEDSQLSALKALVDLDGQAEAKETLSGNSSVASGTFLAPSNDAVQAFYSLLGNGTYPQDLDSTDGLRELSSHILLYHFIPNTLWPAAGVSEPAASTTYGPFATALDTMAGFPRNLTVTTSSSGSAEVTDDALSSGSADVTGVDAKRVTEDGYKNSTLAGRVHLLNSVLLPTDSMLTLKDFASSAPSGYIFTKGTAAIEMFEAVMFAVYGPALRGALFLPSDSAFTSFVDNLSEEGLSPDRFFGNPSLLRAVLYEHAIFDTKVNQSTTTYATWVGSIANTSDHSIDVSFDSSGMVTRFQRSSGGVAGQANTSTVVGSYGPNALGGMIHFVDEVVVSEETLGLVSALKSPADGSWKNLAPGGASNYENITKVLEAVGLGDLFNSSGFFTVFLPTDEALEMLADDFGLTYGQLMSQAAKLKKVIESFIVDKDSADEEGPQADGTRHETRAGDVYLEMLEDGIELHDSKSASGRKLTASSSSGFAGDSVSFFDGTDVFYISSVPLSPETEAELKASLTGNAAHRVIASFLLAALSAISALMFV